METFDVVVVGAGAAGLFCAGVAGQRGLKVLVIDHAEKVAEKIRISGGGRCNFTNLDTTPTHFISDNPRFCRSALSRYTPRDFVNLLEKHGVAHHEKHKGQLFCDGSAEDIIKVLLAECASGGVTRWQPCRITGLHATGQETVLEGEPAPRYRLDTSNGPLTCQSVVMATGGLSIPKIGATDFGYRIARQFDLPVVATRPALVPLTFDEAQWAPFAQLSGLSLPVHISTGNKKSAISFSEDLLFTHRGLSGPGVLQISSYWHADTPICLDLAPGLDVAQQLLQTKTRSRKLLSNELASMVPSRLAETWVAQGAALGQPWDRAVADTPDKALAALGERLSRWELTPSGTEGYRKAEVTAGGVSTAVLSSQTMESRQTGLYFIGEVVDVTGWLGGYNFQWAWASAHACATALADARTAQKS
ncbi:MAG: NAD(P)/FAD-dependent oxidoreductase [Betaproteobacteria bacterium]